MTCGSKCNSASAILAMMLTVQVLVTWCNGQLAGSPTDGSQATTAPDNSSAGSSLNLGSGNLANALGFPAVGGGASEGDFQPLMMLIQNTVDPDSWVNTGTGTSSLFPYPSGVYIDPKGQLQRKLAMDSSLQFQTDSKGPRHPWRTSTPQRTVSLKALDKALYRALQLGLPPTAEMVQLAGLSRIEFLKVDVANEDILISGPASTAIHGFALEDLAVVVARINMDTDPLGCSIDPSNAGLLAAQDLLNQPGSIDRLSRNPKKFMDELQDKIGLHHVRVFGLDSRTGTALALVDADEHMKRVGFGLEKTTANVKSYFEHLEDLKSTQSQSLIRWWFAYTDAPIAVNSRQDVFKLPDQLVGVMSEQQFVSQQGRAPTGKNDLAADAFAKEMSAEITVLRQSHPSYARLCSVFEVALGLQLSLDVTGQPSFAAWFPTLYSAGQGEYDSDRPEPKTVPGLTTSHKMKNGTIVAVVSGGVRLSVKQAADKSKWEETPLLSGSVIPANPPSPSAAHENWWWN